jgi:hypothetical protein
MKALFFFYSSQGPGGGLTLNFFDILAAFKSCRDGEGGRYLNRWRHELEPMDGLLFDFLRVEYKALPENSAQFNLLVNAMIVAMNDADPWPILELDPEEFFVRCLSEADAERFVAPGIEDPIYRHAGKFWLGYFRQAEPAQL